MTRVLCCLLLAVPLAGCETVQPWERGTLAKEEMQWESDVMESRLRGQVSGIADPRKPGIDLESHTVNTSLSHYATRARFTAAHHGVASRRR